MQKHEKEKLWYSESLKWEFKLLPISQGKNVKEYSQDCEVFFFSHCSTVPLPWLMSVKSFSSSLTVVSDWWKQNQAAIQQPETGVFAFLTSSAAAFYTLGLLSPCLLYPVCLLYSRLHQVRFSKPIFRQLQVHFLRAFEKTKARASCRCIFLIPSDCTKNKKNKKTRRVR